MNATAWRSFVDISDGGHVNAASGHGPRPEEHQRLLDFIARLT
jgi:predicted alpha/beta hydrolase family esterase